MKDKKPCPDDLVIELNRAAHKLKEVSGLSDLASLTSIIQRCGMDSVEARPDSGIFRLKTGDLIRCRWVGQEHNKIGEGGIGFDNLIG